MNTRIEITDQKRVERFKELVDEARGRCADEECYHPEQVTRRCYMLGAAGSDVEASRLSGFSESRDTYVADARSDAKVGDTVKSPSGERTYRIIALSCPERSEAFQVTRLT